LTTIIAATPTTPTSSECNFGLELANKTNEPLQKFFVNLHRKIVSQNADKNIIYSPVSIVLALALVEAGASGQTREQLKQVLAPTGYNGDVSSLYQALQHHLKIHQENVKLSVANSLFYDNRFTIKEDYLNRVKNCFETAIEKVDFAQSEAARQKINSWISEATVQKIPELLKPGVLSADTKAVLANAIYLKAAWQKAFDVLEDHKFYSLASADKAKTVKFMVRTGMYKYAGNDDYEVVEIPYKEVPLSMYIIKAKAANTGITAVEPKFQTVAPIKLWESASRRKVALKLPKFTIRLPTDLTGILGELGLGSMFSGSADFSRMDPSSGLRVSSVVHEAYIKVNENGTEAAAATAVIFERTSVQIPSEAPIPFTVDHPFLFSIVHQPTGAFLFAGKVNIIDQNNN
jgi:serpin B